MFESFRFFFCWDNDTFSCCLHGLWFVKMVWHIYQHSWREISKFFDVDILYWNSIFEVKQREIPCSPQEIRRFRLKWLDNPNLPPNNQTTQKEVKISSLQCHKKSESFNQIRNSPKIHQAKLNQNFLWPQIPRIDYTKKWQPKSHFIKKSKYGKYKYLNSMKSTFKPHTF